MKQLIQNMRDGQTTIADVPVPQVKPGTALVKTSYSLVSAGTERMLVEFAEKNLLDKARSRPDFVHQLVDKAYREGILTTLDAAFNRLGQPMLLGYSSSGTIIAVGEGLKDFKPGDRVACSGGNHAVHAEYALIPQNLLTKLPVEVDFASGAFTTVGAIAMHGIRLAKPQIGESVAVIGLGLLGLISVMIAKAAGCRVFGVDIDPERISLAKSLGITSTLTKNTENLTPSFTRGQGFDSVIICADTRSNDPIQLAANIAGMKRTIVAVGTVGLNIQRKIFYEKELKFIVSRSYGPGRYDDAYEEKGVDYPIGYVRWTEGRNFQAFLDLLAEGKVDVRPLITHCFDIDHAPEAYKLITGKQKEKYLAVLLQYPENDEQQSSLKKCYTVQLNPKHGSTSHESTLNLGILGSGNYAQMVFLPNLTKTPEVSRIAVVSSGGLSATHSARKYHFQMASSDEDAVLDDSRVNIVAVLSRHQQHSRQVIRALNSGKHVYCEKPLCLHESELDEIIKVINKPAVPHLMLGFNRRFAPFSIQLKQFFEPKSEPLIIHYRINAGYIPKNHWLHDPDQGGGRIIGEACHFIDYLIYLTGQAPDQVCPTIMPDVQRYFQDNVILTFTFPDGSIGTVSYLANGNKSMPKERIEVFSAGKVAILNDFRQLDLYSEKSHQVIKSRLKQDKGHLNAWKAFLKSVQNNNEPPIPYQQIIDSSLASLIAQKAVASHQIMSLPQRQPSI